MRLNILWKFYVFVHERVRYDDDTYTLSMGVWTAVGDRGGGDGCNTRHSFEKMNSTLEICLFLAFTTHMHWAGYTHAHARTQLIRSSVASEKYAAIICFIYLFLSKTIIHLHWPRILPLVRFHNNFVRTENRDSTTSQQRAGTNDRTNERTTTKVRQ